MKDYMILPFEFKALEQDEKYYYVEGYSSTYGNVDLGNDRCVSGCFRDDLLQNGTERPALWQHDARQPVGVKVFTDGLKGLMFRAKLPKDDDFVSKRVIPQIEVGSVKACSIGYEPLEYDFTNEGGSQIRNLKRCKLYESSFVTFPMNPQAVISVRKSIDSINKKEFKSTDKSFNEYLVGFAKGQFDEEVKLFPLADEKTEYIKANKTESELPFIRNIDGIPKAIPKGIYNFVGFILGYKEDIEKYKNVLNSYYEKLGKEKPFNENGEILIDIETLKSFENRDLIKIFDKDVILSNAAKKYVLNSFGSSDVSKRDEDSDIILKCRLLREQMEDK